MPARDYVVCKFQPDTIKNEEKVVKGLVSPSCGPHNDIISFFGPLLKKLADPCTTVYANLFFVYFILLCLKLLQT